MLGIYCPTYGRAHKLQAVATNIEQATKTPFKLYWGVEPDDLESIEAAKATGHTVVVNKGNKGYSDTVQTMYEQADEPIFFCANDDFFFPDGWDVRPIENLSNNPETMVLGVHDGNPKTRYYTVMFIRRLYIEEQSGVVDMPNRVFYPYQHNYQDTEFSETAANRGVWDRLEGPCIHHLNPGLSHVFGDIQNDPTYDKNNATAGADARTYDNRRHLW